MKIMICDDDLKELEKMKNAADKLIASHGEISFIIKCFTNPFDFVGEIEENGPPDIALLDVCMPGILGTEIAEKLRSQNEDATDVIFLSTSSEFAVEAFSLHASDYICKPYTSDRLEEALNKAVERRQQRYFVPLQCGKEAWRIDLYTVLYAETVGGIIEVHLKDGNVLKTRNTMYNIQNLFNDIEGFIMVGASYIVNLRFVEGINQNVLQITGGTDIPIPRRLRNEIKDQCFEFYTKSDEIKF